MSGATIIQSDVVARYLPQVRAAQVQAVLSRMPIVLLVDLTFSSCLIFVLLWDLPAGQLLGWLVSHALIDAAAVMFYFGGRAASAKDRTGAASRSIVFQCLLLGGYWGVLNAYMYTFSSEWLHLYNTFIIAGMLAVLSVAVLGEHLPALAAFLLSSMAPPAARAVSTGDVEQALLGLFGLSGIVLLLLIAKARNASAAETLAIRFAMTDLARELAERRDAADKANAAKSKFLAAVSHDLRQPLHALTLLTAVLEKTSRGTDSSCVVTDVQNAVESLDKMFAGLLDLSRLDAGVLRPALRHFDIDEFLRQICVTYLPEAQSKGLRVEYEACASIAYSDPLLLERVIRNYASNAIRHTERGAISVRCLPDGDRLRIEVIDSGKGVPPAQRAIIFDEYVQLNNPERDRNKGLGLGLAIVRRVAELLGYSFGVDSAAGGGACFFICVPRGEQASIVTEPVSRDFTPDLTGLRVVVIDDDFAILDGTRRLLESWGCICVTAESETEAFELSRKQFDAIDAVIADYRLRGERTGVQAVLYLRQAFGSEIPALFVSGDTMPELLQEAAASGFTLVHKPVQLPVLKIFLNSVRRTKNEATQIC